MTFLATPHWPGTQASLILGLLLVALGSVASPPGTDLPSREVVRVEGTVVELRAGTDPEVAAQVRRALPRAIRAAARWVAVPAAITLTVHPTHAGLEEATGRSGSPWMRAWARIGSVDLQSPRSWSRGRATDEALTQILAHELTHCALFQVVGRARDIPAWFQEGMASVAAGEHHTLARADAVSVRSALLASDPRLFYGSADRAFRVLVQRSGDAGVRRLLSRLGEGRPFPAAFQDATGLTVTDFEADLASRLAPVALGG
jgi:hypothetical protein